MLDDVKRLVALFILANCIQLAAFDLLNSFDDEYGGYYQNEHEQRLLEKLLRNYNNKLKPSGTLQIKLALNLYQMIDVIEKDQTMVINAFVDHKWFDKRLSWEPAEYGNLTLIRINGERLWIPDTFIYTTAEKNGLLISQSGLNSVVSSKGEIFWPIPLNNLRVRCRMEISWFPFDEQLCSIVFGSWSYSLHYLNYSLIYENASLDTYTENNVWKLIDFKPFRTEVRYEAWIENDTFSEVVYKILIRRKPLFVLQNSVVPSVMLCILTLVSFFIPYAPKMQIGISIMLAFSVFKLRLSDDVPVQSDIIPLINIYFLLCMAFSLTAMIWFSLKNILSECATLPPCIRYLVLRYIWYMLFLNFSTKYKKLNKEATNEAENDYEDAYIKVKNKNHVIGYDKRGHHETKSLVLNIRRCSSTESEHHKQLKSHSLVIRNDDENERNNNLNYLKRKKRKHHQQHLNSSLRGNESLKGDTIEPKSYNEILLCTNNNNQSEIHLNLNASNSQKNYYLKQRDTQERKLKKSKQPKHPPSSCHRSDGIRARKLSDIEILEILNLFVFFMFLIFITSLNLLCLYILPYFVKKSFSIND